MNYNHPRNKQGQWSDARIGDSRWSKIQNWLLAILLIALAAIAAMLDDTMQVRQLDILPEPPKNEINYGKP